MEFMKQHRRAIYIALALCVVAAGVTGYLLTNRETPNQQASANQPVVDVKPPVVTPVTPDLPVQEEPQEDEEPPVEAVAELLPQVVSPLDGTTVTVFSMSELLYDETMADWRTHEGLDIQAAEGDAVKTAAAGEVTSVTRDELMGTTVCITHSGGYVTRYSSLLENPPHQSGSAGKGRRHRGLCGHGRCRGQHGPPPAFRRGEGRKPHRSQGIYQIKNWHEI